MALREVTVEVTAKYITKVIAGNGKEAQEQAKNLVMIGAISPCETNAIILDVKATKENSILPKPIAEEVPILKYFK